MIHKNMVALILAGGQGLIQVKRPGAAAGAPALLPLQADDDGGDAELLRQAGGHDAADAMVPMLGGQHDGLLRMPGIPQHIQSFPEDPVLHAAPLRVHGAELSGQALGFPPVLRHEQVEGHIRLATAVFPDGTSGTQLDVLARYAMWQDHKNYGHGTGHGVGSYLSVHEGPHQFRMNWMPAPLHAGMTITIEPGIYIAGSHGCRTENTMLIVEDSDSNGQNSPAANGQGSTWLRLEPLTLCPIDTTPIVRELMAPDEIAYLNTYHTRVRESLLPLLDDAADREWLISHTAPI